MSRHDYAHTHCQTEDLGLSVGDVVAVMEGGMPKRLTKIAAAFRQYVRDTDGGKRCLDGVRRPRIHCGGLTITRATDAHTALLRGDQ